MPIQSPLELVCREPSGQIEKYHIKRTNLNQYAIVNIQNSKLLLDSFWLKSRLQKKKERYNIAQSIASSLPSESIIVILYTYSAITNHLDDTSVGFVQFFNTIILIVLHYYIAIAFQNYNEYYRKFK